MVVETAKQYRQNYAKLHVNYAAFECWKERAKAIKTDTCSSGYLLAQRKLCFSRDYSFGCEVSRTKEMDTKRNSRLVGTYIRFMQH